MIRSIAATLVLGASLLACNDQESVAREQQEEQRELSQEQAQERAELAREQAAERERAAAAAREDLTEQTAEVQEQRGELTAEARQLQESIALACQGTAANLVDACPIDRRYLTAANDTREGVTFHLNQEAGSEESFERRVACYRARASLRAGTAATPVPAENACVLDLADVTYDVSEDDGHIVVALTTSVRARVEELRAHGRRLTTRDGTAAARN